MSRKPYHIYKPKFVQLASWQVQIIISLCFKLASIHFIVNLKWTNKVYKQEKDDDRIPVDPEPKTNRKRNQDINRERQF